MNPRLSDLTVWGWLAAGAGVAVMLGFLGWQSEYGDPRMPLKVVLPLGVGFGFGGAVAAALGLLALRLPVIVFRPAYPPGSFDWLWVMIGRPLRTPRDGGGPDESGAA